MTSRFAWSCHTCRGSGRSFANPAETCPVCQGAGKNIVEGYREEFTTCLPCNGGGYVGNDRTNICKVCGGLGLVTIASVMASQ